MGAQLVPPLAHPIATIERDGMGRSHHVMNPAWGLLFTDLCRDLDKIRAVAVTHATRLARYPAGDQEDGALLVETDRRFLYRALGKNWIAVGGTMEAARADAPTDLAANDAGVRLHVTDFGHVLRWTGTIWEWADTDLGNGFYQEFHAAPTASGWVKSTASVATTQLTLGATLTETAVLTRAAAAAWNAANAVYFRR